MMNILWGSDITKTSSITTVPPFPVTPGQSLNITPTPICDLSEILGRWARTINDYPLGMAIFCTVLQLRLLQKLENYILGNS